MGWDEMDGIEWDEMDGIGWDEMDEMKWRNGVKSESKSKKKQCRILIAADSV